MATIDTPAQPHAQHPARRPEDDLVHDEAPATLAPADAPEGHPAARVAGPTPAGRAWLAAYRGAVAQGADDDDAQRLAFAAAEAARAGVAA